MSIYIYVDICLHMHRGGLAEKGILSSGLEGRAAMCRQFVCQSWFHTFCSDAQVHVRTRGVSKHACISTEYAACKSIYRPCVNTCWTCVYTYNHMCLHRRIFV